MLISDSFLALTPERVLDAVEAAGLRCNAVCYPLNSFENRVYEVELADRTRVVAKFYRPGRWRPEQILEEHRFLAELDAAEIPVTPMRVLPGGSTLRSIEDIHYAIADRRGGRAPDELDDALVARLGMLVARLHNVGAERDAPSRWRLSTEHYVREPVAWLRAHQVLPRSLERRYADAALAIAAHADRMLEGVATHRLHGDLHLGNVLLRDGQLRLLDFDDMAVGPAVQDVWLALPGRDAETVRQRQLLVDAYEQFRPFDRATLRLIEPLRGMRMVHFAAWLARRWDDPGFRAAWPEFGTPEHWERETIDLEEQLGAIERGVAAEAPRLRGEAAREEPILLSNRDYFWDWEGQ
jgi:Ser/Thr protein kinase RdoA (MazF antagonist)